MTTELHAGMHDDPSIFPTLPGKRPDVDAAWLADVDHGIWQTCWEYVLTHELTAAEGAAFWTAASLVHAAMTTHPRPLRDEATAANVGDQQTETEEQ